MKSLIATVVLVLVSSTAMAQSVGNTGPARANTADPNGAPWMGDRGTRSTTTGRGLDQAGKANTSDPNSVRSGATGPTGRPIDPTANPRRR